MTRDTGKTAIDLKNLKVGGFIKERSKDLFTVRAGDRVDQHQLQGP